MANTVSFTTNLPGTLSVVPNQNTTLTVAPSANFNVSSYTYQWKKNGTNITGATSASYSFEPALGDNNATYACVVNGLSATSSGNVSQANQSSDTLTLTVAVDTGTFAKWTPKSGQPNTLNESGEERFKRMRHLGYC